MAASSSDKLAYMNKRDDRVRFLAKLPPGLHRWLKVAAAEQGTDMNALLTAALEAARNREAIAQAIAAALEEAAISDWESEPGEGKEIEIYVSQIPPIVARILAEGATT